MSMQSVITVVTHEGVKKAVSQLHLSALFYVGLVLFLITVIVNALARALIWRVARGSAAGSSAV